MESLTSSVDRRRSPPIVSKRDAQRVVVVMGSIPVLPESFAEQLAVFGMTLVRAGDVAEAGELLDFSGDQLEVCILLADIDYLAAKSQRLVDLKNIRIAHPGRTITALVGDRDDFKARLRAVRFGGDVFVPAPIDTSSLTGSLDTVLKQRWAEPYHVLIVDDDPEQVSATALALQQAGMITSVVTDPRHIFRVLVEYKPELILMDLYMPECSGAELAAVIRQNESYVNIPIVFLSVEQDSLRQVEAIRQGGDDFIMKPYSLEHLVRTVRKRASRTRQMRYFMERDSLTGLLNHSNLKERLDHEIQRAGRIETGLVFVMIDIDRFKRVNDTYGHLTGDRVIKSLARLLVESLRRTDVVGRYGGEEFGVILFNTSSFHARRIVDQIRDRFSKVRHYSPDGEFSVTFSGGLAAYPEYETAVEVNEAADAALYMAKEAGRNRVRVAGQVTTDQGAPDGS